MEVLEYLKTCFKLIVAFMTQDVLFCIALIFLGFLILWSVLSLTFCYEMDFKLDCEKVTRYVKANKIHRDNYVQLTSLFLTMSTSIRRAWKSYELCVGGMPSDYLKQFECLDMQVNSGFKSHIKGVLNFFIYTAFAFFTLVSFATVVNYGAALTTKVLVEAMLLPLAFLFLAKVVFHIYFAIRNYEYKLAVESFNDMVDILDERVSLAEIFYGYEDAVSMVSNVYSNETLNKIKLEENKVAIKELKKEERARKALEQQEVKDARMEAIAQERERRQVEKKMNQIDKIKSSLPEEVVKQEEIEKQKTEEQTAKLQKIELDEAIAQKAKRGRGRPRKEKPAEQTNAPKRGRGRPRKERPVEQANAPKRGRGRPRKDAQAPVVKEEQMAPVQETEEVKVVNEAPRTATVQTIAEEGAINTQKEFIAAMNEVETLLDANAVTTATAKEIEANNKRIDELVEKMMAYKKLHEEE